MAKVTHLGSAKPDDPIYSTGSVIGGKRFSTLPKSGAEGSPTSAPKPADSASPPSSPKSPSSDR